MLSQKTSSVIAAKPANSMTGTFHELEGDGQRCATRVRERLRSSKLASPAEWRYVLNLLIQVGVDPIGWDAHDVSVCVSEAQADSAAVRVSCRGRSGRADRGGRRCGRQKRLERPRSIPLSRAAPASRSWPSFRSATSGSPSTTPRVDPAGAGVERHEGTRDARRDLQRHPEGRGPFSNLYDDAYMPHMQRITWSGIALHGGVLPGRPASHGCIRLPFDFAERLFDTTAMGMRVIVAPGDVAPVELSHPLLFKPKPGAAALAASRTAEAQEAARKRPGEARRGDGLPGGLAGQGAGSRGGKSEA